MMSDAFPLIFGLLAIFIVMPLLVHFPIYVWRYRRMKRIAAVKGPQYRPSSTLLTLNVWLIVVLVSLVMAVPNFLRFNSKAVQSEAKTNLGAIFTSQVAYFGEYDTYAGRKGENGSGAFTDLGWTPWPESNTRYAYYAGGDFIAPNRPEHKLPFKPDAGWPYPMRPGQSAKGFTVMAVGNIDGDSCLDVWTMNDVKELRNVVNDITNEAEPGMGAPCGPASATGLFWHKVVENVVVKFLLIILGLFALTSPLMIIVVPVMYYLGIKQNRLYGEAMAAMREAPTPKPSE